MRKSFTLQPPSETLKAWKITLGLSPLMVSIWSAESCFHCRTFKYFKSLIDHGHDLRYFLAIWLPPSFLEPLKQRETVGVPTLEIMMNSLITEAELEVAVRVRMRKGKEGVCVRVCAVAWRQWHTTTGQFGTCLLKPNLLWVFRFDCVSERGFSILEWFFNLFSLFFLFRLWASLYLCQS